MTTAILLFFIDKKLVFCGTMCQFQSLPRPLLIPDPQNATIEELKQPKDLPPYSLDLNPIERIWLTMKARWLNNDVCKNEEKLLERLDQVFLDVIHNPKRTQKTGCIGTFL